MKIHKFISYFPAFGLILQALQLALLKSKNPIIFNVYSLEKFIAIIFLILLGITWFFLFSSIIERFFSRLIVNNYNFNFYKIYLLISLLAGIYIFPKPCSVGEDISKQILSSYLYLNGKVNFPNYDNIIDPKDLSKTYEKWIPRPPGISYFLIPFLFFGLPIGLSIKLSLYLLKIVIGLGWLRIACKFNVSRNWMQFFAVILGLSMLNLNFNFSSASIITAATFPWLLLWVIGLSAENSPKSSKIFHLKLTFFYLALGIHAFFKLSSLVSLTALASIPILLSYNFGSLNFRRLSLYCLCSLSFFVPYILLNYINYKLTGTGSDIYGGQDFNAQHELWGHYITESTRGWMLVASLVSHATYSTSLQFVLHGFRDFFLHFDSVINYLHQFQINPKVFSICLISTPISTLLFYIIFKIKNKVKECNWYVFIAIIFIPTLGFGLASYLHGFNYLIYPSYSTEYSTIFFILGLCIASNTDFNIINKKVTHVISYLLLGVPCYKIPLDIYHSLNHENESKFTSNYETTHFLGHSKFSNQLESVAVDSQTEDDICIFLCAENYGDYPLRTDKRSISIHFAKDNLSNIPSFQSTKALNVYCILSEKLVTDTKFIEQMKKKFPVNSFSKKLDDATWKFEFTPI